MAEPEKDQIGDGQDNFGQAAGKAIQAANANCRKRNWFAERSCLIIPGK